MDSRAVTIDSDGRFEVAHSLIPETARKLTPELMPIQAAGDFDAAERVLRNRGVVRPEVEQLARTSKHNPQRHPTTLRHDGFVDLCDTLCIKPTLARQQTREPKETSSTLLLPADSDQLFVPSTAALWPGL